MTRQERIEDSQDRRYPGMRFSDCYGRFIKINGRLSLRQALSELEAARRHVSDAMAIEGRVSGARAYEMAQQATKIFRREEAEAKANAQAAFYRATGRWPHVLYDLGIR